MAVTVRAIERADLPAVGAFLHQHLNQRVSAAAWQDAVRVPWPVEAPNFGFLLDADGVIVGAYLAFYSDRTVNAQVEHFCNLGAWCVRDDHRLHSLKLLKALLAQPGYTFTDLSPSGTVVPLNERLKFTHLDTSTALLPGLPWPSRPGRIRISSAPTVLNAHLTGRDREIYTDHRDAAAARHYLIRRGDEQCYVILRRDRRKNLPVFASILYVSNPALFRATAPVLARHLLVRHGILATLAELRIVHGRPRPSLLVPAPRRKMYKSAHLGPEHIDYLYSELVRLAW